MQIERRLLIRSSTTAANAERPDMEARLLSVAELVLDVKYLYLEGGVGKWCNVVVLYECLDISLMSFSVAFNSVLALRPI